VQYHQFNYGSYFIIKLLYYPVGTDLSLLTKLTKQSYTQMLSKQEV